MESDYWRTTKTQTHSQKRKSSCHALKTPRSSENQGKQGKLARLLAVIADQVDEGADEVVIDTLKKQAAVLEAELASSVTELNHPPSPSKISKRPHSTRRHRSNSARGARPNSARGSRPSPLGSNAAHSRKEPSALWSPLACGFTSQIFGSYNSSCFGSYLNLGSTMYMNFVFYFYSRSRYSLKPWLRHSHLLRPPLDFVQAICI